MSGALKSPKLEGSREGPDVSSTKQRKPETLNLVRHKVLVT